MKNDKYIIVIDNSFVFLGELIYIDNDNFTIANCYNIRKFGTNKGLGQIAIEGVQKETILDSFGIITFPKSRMLFKIKCTHESFK